MCGIAGYWRTAAADTADTSGDLLRAMTAAIAHRGPDGEGFHCDAVAGVGLGHRRLAILDLTESGEQPMSSASGRFVIVLNGEIYNFRSLRRALERPGVSFRGHSDTEVVLEAIEQWGLEAAVSRFVGMFAFALWDREQRELSLVRDRAGKKPLYLLLRAHELYFGSELRALLSIPGLNPGIDRQAVGQYLRYGFIPAPRSILQGCRKIGPGTIVRVRVDGSGQLVAADATYWSAADVYRRGRERRRQVGFDGASREIEVLLEDAVRIRLESDVPLGAFLSGGIDSSVVVALMQRLCPRPVRTFTIGFDSDDYDEASYAARIARYLGTDHTELYLGESEILDIVTRMTEVFDEPFADSSQLPTLLVAQLARRHVTVALSGDGGDEVFGGYRRYQRFVQWWSRLAGVPLPARALAASTASLVARLPLGPLWPVLGRLFPGDVGSVSLPQQFAKLASLMRLQTVDEAYERQLAHWPEPERVAPGARPPWWQPLGEDPGTCTDAERCFERMMEIDFGHYLPDDILVKVDRTSMSQGLETRAPLLDHRIVEFAAELPVAYRVRAGDGKVLLKDVAYRLVPRQLLERPKQGFGVPLADWLRGPLREWADDLLMPATLDRSGLVGSSPVQSVWREHLAGQRDWSAALWDVLMLQSWFDRYGRLAGGNSSRP